MYNFSEKIEITSSNKSLKINKYQKLCLYGYLKFNILEVDAIF